MRIYVKLQITLDKRNSETLVSTTVSLSGKVGATECITQLVTRLMDESEPFRKMTVQAIDRTLEKTGGSELDNRLVERLIDGMLYAFQEVGSEQDVAILNGFGTIVNALGLRISNFLAKICGNSAGICPILRSNLLRTRVHLTL